MRIPKALSPGEEAFALHCRAKFHPVNQPEREYVFAPPRKWRFDFAWHMVNKVALEVDGGIWIRGGHNRGAQIKATWEKENEAQIMGWKILKCEPKDLCTIDTVNLIRRALEL